MKFTFNSGRILSPMPLTLVLTMGIVAFSFNSGLAQVGQPSETDVNSIAYHNIDVATFDILRKDRSNVKVDVRAPDEIALGRLGGSLELDFNSVSFVSELEKLDKDKHYLVFSTNGIKSAKAAQKMTELGFTNVSNLQGGFTMWMAADRPPE